MVGAPGDTLGPRGVREARPAPHEHAHHGVPGDSLAVQVVGAAGEGPYRRRDRDRERPRSGKGDGRGWLGVHWLF